MGLKKLMTTKDCISPTDFEILKQQIKICMYNLIYWKLYKKIKCIFAA